MLKKLSRKTKERLLTAFLFLAVPCTLIGFALTVNIVITRLLKGLYVKTEMGYSASRAIDLGVHVICVVIFVYFSYKWHLKEVFRKWWKRK